MTTHEKVEALIRQARELPEEAQAEVVESLVEMRSQQFGTYRLDQGEREALQRSAADERFRRFATDDEIADMFESYKA